MAISELSLLNTALVQFLLMLGRYEVFMTKKAAMDARTTLDFKTILSEWKQFQHYKLKLKMANMFRCNFNAHSNGVPYVLHNLTLTCITEPEEPHLLFRNGIITIKILLTDLNGYNTEGGIIALIVNSERNIGVIRLEFPTEAVHELVLAELEAFTREMPLLPTPPSSESSGSE